MGTRAVCYVSYSLMDVLNNQHGIVKIFYKGALGSLRRIILINKHMNAADDIARTLFTMLSATLSAAFFSKSTNGIERAQ